MELSVETTSKGVRYYHSHTDAPAIYIQGRHNNHKVTVSMNGDVAGGFYRNGNLAKSEFRRQLVELARTNFGDVNGFADDLEFIAGRLKDDLAGREKASDNYGVAELRGTPYRIQDGGFVRVKKEHGHDIDVQLCNFTGKIIDEIIYDEGEDSEDPTIFFVIEVWKGDRSLGTVTVSSEKYDAMRWVRTRYGTDIRINPGIRNKEYVADAIHVYSGTVPRRRQYKVTGWTTINGEPVYLHEGRQDAEVELEGELKSRYVLPEPPASPEELRDAVLASLEVWGLGPERVTVPLSAAAYVAPLSGAIIPDFVLYPYGRGGSLKSALAALVASHYGDFRYDTLPMSFESTTNFTERCLYLLKDTVAIVDDLHPGANRRESEELNRKLSKLFRGVGNRSGRGRMRADITNRISFAPRGVVIATGEYLPEGSAFQSAESRGLALPVRKDSIDLQKLIDLDRRKGLLSKATRAYTDWIAADKKAIEKAAKAQREAVRGAFVEDGQHPRTPSTLATLYTGIDTFLRFAVESGALSDNAANTYRSIAKDALKEAGQKHTDATKGTEPAENFLELLKAAFDSQQVTVKVKSKDEPMKNPERLGRRYNHYSKEHEVPRGATYIGWVDHTYLYLEPTNAYVAISEFARKGDIPLGVPKSVLWRNFKEMGLSECSSDRSNATVRLRDGTVKRVIKVPLHLLLTTGDSSMEGWTTR